MVRPRREPVPLETRFWAKVDKNGPIPEHRPALGPCWVWTGRLDEGYGKFKAEAGVTRAHRVALSLATHTPLASLPLVCHACDNRACVRNDTISTYEVNGQTFVLHGHLFAGTKTVNSQDSWQKGRAKPAPVLLGAQGQELIQRYMRGGVSQQALAEEYGVSQSSVSKLISSHKSKS